MFDGFHEYTMLLFFKTWMSIKKRVGALGCCCFCKILKSKTALRIEKLSGTQLFFLWAWICSSRFMRHPEKPVVQRLQQRGLLKGKMPLCTYTSNTHGSKNLWNWFCYSLEHLSVYQHWYFLMTPAWFRIIAEFQLSKMQWSLNIFK